MRNNGKRAASVNATRHMLKMDEKKKTSRAIFGEISPEEIGKPLLDSFSLSFSRSKYWFRTKIPAVARMKEKENETNLLIGGMANRTLPNAKLNSHPIQLSNLSILRQLLMVLWSTLYISATLMSLAYRANMVYACGACSVAPVFDVAEIMI